jgi:hypothetical protein
MNYQKLHNYLADELGILPIQTEMQEIVEIVKAMLAEEEAEQDKPAAPPTEIPEHYPKGC